MKIDLFDALPDAHLFDPERYTVLGQGKSLEEILRAGLDEFQKLNRAYDSWDDWQRNASDGAYEVEIFSEDGEELDSLFRGSILWRGESVLPALQLAMKYHSGQRRKGDGLEYMVHILQITRLLEQRGYDGEVIAAAFCHDLLEDTDCPETEIFDRCGPKVVNIVLAVTNDPDLENPEDWEKKKENYITSVLAGGQKAMAVCVADKIVNLRSLYAAYEKQGEAVFSKFNRGKEQKLWFEKKVAKSVKGRLKGPLVSEYLELLKRFPF